MPSAANAKSEKPASSEALDNTPIRQIITIIEHKIRNLEKRKSKLTSYRDLQKAGKELHGDQKVAVAKYDEVAQTLEFARDLSKQVTGIVVSAEREAKKQAKREAWVRYAADSNKIREVLLILDCLMQMGNNEAREDFLNGTNGAVKLTEEDLKILDDLYPEVTPKHEINEEGQPGFHIQTVKAAEHLYAIIDGKPKEVLGTTYTHIKEIVTTVHECGYFDRTNQNDLAEAEENRIPTAEEELQEQVEDEVEAEVVSGYPGGVGVGVGVGSLPVPPAPAVVPAPAYPLRPLPPITLQEVEHAYFAQQYPQQRPIAEVIGSQNFFFLQESEIDSPICTPQPPQIPNQASPPGPIPSQTFTNHHFVQLPAGCLPDDQAMAHFQTDNGAYPGVVSLCPRMTLATALSSRAGPPPQRAALNPPPVAAAAALPVVAALPVAAPAPAPATTAPEDKNDDEWKEGRSPEREEGADRRTQGQGDGQGRYRRYGRGPPRGAPNGHRGRGSFQSRQGGDGYRGRHGGDYQSRPGKDGYQSRQYDGYQSRQAKDGYQSRGGDDGYYGNGDTGESHQQQQSENGAGGRERYNDSTQNYQGGFKGRGRGGPRGGPRGASRPPRAHHYNRKPENVD